MHNSKKRFPQKKYTSEILLTSEQVRALLDATEKQPAYRDLHDAARIMLRTGLRRGELAAARWSHVDLHRGLLRIPACKGRKTLHVFLDESTVALLKARRDHAGDAEFVMGCCPSTVMVRITLQFRRMAKDLNLPAGGLHLLRRTALRGALLLPPKSNAAGP